MSNEATLPCDPSLARQMKQLDGMGMSAVEREGAKEQLRRAEAIVEMTARAWGRARSCVRRLRGGAVASRGAAGAR